jgi:hypothetical protein
VSPQHPLVPGRCQVGMSSTTCPTTWARRLDPWDQPTSSESEAAPRHSFCNAACHQWDASPLGVMPSGAGPDRTGVKAAARNDRAGHVTRAFFIAGPARPRRVTHFRYEEMPHPSGATPDRAYRDGTLSVPVPERPEMICFRWVHSPCRCRYRIHDSIPALTPAGELE